MKHFLRISQNAAVVPVLLGLMNKPELWDENDLRTTHPESPHRECSDVWLMFNELKENQPEAVVNDREVVPYVGWYALPEAQEIVFDLLRLTRGVRLGRVIISKLPPGKTIAPHVDGGAPAEYFTRFQVCLQSGPGCLFKIEDEVVQFAPGEVWRINNRAQHGVINNSADDRICMVVDIRIE